MTEGCQDESQRQDFTGKILTSKEMAELVPVIVGIDIKPDETPLAYKVLVFDDREQILFECE